MLSTLLVLLGAAGAIAAPPEEGEVGLYADPGASSQLISAPQFSSHDVFAVTNLRGELRGYQLDWIAYHDHFVVEVENLAGEGTLSADPESGSLEFVGTGCRSVEGITALARIRLFLLNHPDFMLVCIDVGPSIHRPRSRSARPKAPSNANPWSRSRRSGALVVLRPHYPMT